jgi:hypothetical protein
LLNTNSIKIRITAIQTHKSAILNEGHLKKLIPKSRKSITAQRNNLSIKFPNPPAIIRQKAYLWIFVILSLLLQNHKNIENKRIKTTRDKNEFLPWNILKAVPVLVIFVILKKFKNGIMLTEETKHTNLFTKNFVN